MADDTTTNSEEKMAAAPVTESPANENRPAEGAGDPQTGEAAGDTAEVSGDDENAADGRNADAPDETEQTLEEEEEATRSAIAELETELMQVKDQMLRAVAEAENVRKRAAKQTEDAHKYANANFAKSLLSVADNLRRAIEAVPEEKVGDDQLLSNLLEGVGAVERELLNAFQQHGIEKLEPLGEAFDPHFHQAMFEIESADDKPGTIVQLMAPGYIMNGRLLRPAMVGIAKAPQKGTAGDAPDG